MDGRKKVLIGTLAALAMQPVLIKGLNRIYSIFAPDGKCATDGEAEATTIDESSYLDYKLSDRRLDFSYLPEEWNRMDSKKDARTSGEIILEERVAEPNKETKKLSEYLRPLFFYIEELPERVEKIYDKLTDKKNTDNLNKILDRVMQYKPIIEFLAKKYDIPVDILYAIALVESRANANVNSNGIMQITPIAAKHLNNLQNRLQKDNGVNVIDCYKRKYPEIGLECGAMLIRYYFDAFAGKDLDRETQWLCAIAAYNRGKGGLNGDLKKAKTTNPFELKPWQTTAEAYMYPPKVVAMMKALKEQ